MRKIKIVEFEIPDGITNHKLVICNRCLISISVKRLFITDDNFPHLVCPQCGNHDSIVMVHEHV